jgi:hypothetical protein
VFGQPLDPVVALSLPARDSIAGRTVDNSGENSQMADFAFEAYSEVAGQHSPVHEERTADLNCWLAHYFLEQHY